MRRLPARNEEGFVGRFLVRAFNKAYAPLSDRLLDSCQDQI
jgi:hypothetical protein